MNLDALTKWVGHYPDDILADMAEIAPMLAKLGYDPTANPPDYGQPDAFVVNKTLAMHKDAKLWYNKAVAMVANPDWVDRPNAS